MFKHARSFIVSHYEDENYDPNISESEMDTEKEIKEENMEE